MKGFENWREEERQRPANYEVMRSYEGSPEYQAFQRRKHLEKLLEMTPTLSEAGVVELMTSPDFKEFPAEVQQALTDRMLQLENNATQKRFTRLLSCTT